MGRRIVRATYLLLCSTMRKVVWPSLLSLGILFVTGIYLKVYAGEPALAVHMTAYGQLLLTITFMMLGIHLKSEARNVYMDDVVAAYSKNSNFSLKSKLLLLFILDITVSSIILGVIFFSSLHGGAALWSKQIVLHVILLYFLPCYALGVWGMLIAQWNTGRSVYLPAILVWIATSSLTTDLNSYFAALGIQGGWVQSVFNMGVVNMRHIQGIVMTPPIERPWWIMRVVISVLLTLLVLSGNSRRRAVASADRRRKMLFHGFAILSAATIIVFLCAQYSVFFSRFADSSVRSDYVRKKAAMYIPGKSVSLAEYPSEKNIRIDKNDIVLSCSDEGIQAQVEITAQMNKDARGQAFTLYSDFIVDKVLVDGETADFARSHDGLMVYFQKEKALGERIVFHFQYHGYSLPIFPANETTVQLNRAFPWFPWPGIKMATRYHNFYDFHESEDFFIENWQRGDKVEYSLHYKGPGALYSNLRHEKGNFYRGSSSDGVSLYSGMICETFRGIEVYTPGSQNKNASAAVSAVLDSYDTIKKLSERMGVKHMPMPPKSVTVIEMAPPVILSYPAPYPNELHAWGDEWEIRQTSTSGTIVERKHYGDNIAGYQGSPYVQAYMPITYLLSTSSGYPIDVPHSSTMNFSNWLSYYLLARMEQKNTEKQPYDTEIDEDFGVAGTNGFYDFINGAAVPKDPISPKERERIKAIAQRMQAGEDFDASFRHLYQRLLKKEMVTPSEMITTLYNNIGG